MAPGQLKYNLMRVLVQFIYQQVDKRRDGQLETIIGLNDVANNSTTRAQLIFSYSGRRWTRHRFKGVPQRVPGLEESLHAEMDKYIDEGAKIEQEKPMIEAYLRAIMNSDPDPIVAMLRIPTALQHPIRDAITAAKADTGLSAELNFEQCAELVGAYPKAVETIKKRMMLNVLLE